MLQCVAGHESHESANSSLLRDTAVSSAWNAKSSAAKDLGQLVMLSLARVNQTEIARETESAGRVCRFDSRSETSGGMMSIWQLECLTVKLRGATKYAIVT